MAFHQIGGGIEKRVQGGHLARLDEAKMTVRHGNAGGPGDAAEHRYPERRCRIAQHSGMAVAADAVEDHAGHRHIVAEGGKAVHRRRRALRLRARIDHEDHRQAEQCRRIGRGA